MSFYEKAKSEVVVLPQKRVVSGKKAEAEEIAAELAEGRSVEEVALDHLKPVSEVIRIAEERHIEYEIPELKGIDKSGRFTKRERLELLDDLVDKTYEVMEGKELTTNDLKNLAITAGILIDKRRLEEGLSTANTETHIQKTTVKAWGRRALPAPK